MSPSFQEHKNDESAETRRNDSRKDQLYKILHEPKAVRRLFLRKAFNALQRLGIHVTADHFYEPIPNTVDIAKNYNSGPRPCRGIEFNAQPAIAYCLRILARFGGEFHEATSAFGYYIDNTYFRGVDGLMLYCVLRDTKPQRVVEVGQGFSTRVSLAALERNAREDGSTPQLLSIDPYARFAPTGTAVKLEIQARRLQDSLDLIRDRVGAGDMLFVDSSHVHKFGSDVELFFDEIYPNLAKGVLVHIHDIFSPYDYPISWTTQQKRFWNEQYHLENFLRGNSAFEIVLPLHLAMRQSAEVNAVARALIPGGEFLYTGQSMYLRTR